MTLDIPLLCARWVLSKYFHGNTLFELPNRMTLGKSYAPWLPWDSSYYTLSDHENLGENINDELDDGHHEGTD